MDRNEKIWAWSNTGTKIHAFIERGGVKRVGMCRSNMYRSSTAAFDAIDNLATGHKFNVCTRCLELAEAMWDRAEASMQPATESHDLGYVAPVGKFTDAQRDAMQDEFDAAVAAAQAPKADEAGTAKVDHSDEKIWAYASKGVTAHAFIALWADKNGKESADYLRAVCRSTIVHHVGLSRSVKDAAINVCGTCEMKLAAFEKEAAALYDQAVAAMRDEIAPEFPAGTRVVSECGVTGTVQNLRGNVTARNHLNYGMPFVEIQTDSTPMHPRGVRRRRLVSSLTNLDALHAEALEMDELETAMVAAGEPQRFHYRAVLATTGGTPLDGIEGYINALDRDVAEAMLQERYQTDLIRLTSLRINPA